MTKKEDNKTLAIKLRFWTNELPGRVGKDHKQTPCWSSGVAIIEANKTKKISSDSEVFNYMDDIPRAIKELMKRAKIALVEDINHTERAKKRQGKK
ncbi:MAG: hypothetical protein ACKKL6_00540 [Candidatus Komeilibacteria bacterium]